MVEGVPGLLLDTQGSCQGSQGKLLNVVEAVVDVTPGPVTRPSTWLMTFGGLPWTLRQVAKASRGSLWTWLKKAVGDILKDTNL